LKLKKDQEHHEEIAQQKDTKAQRKKTKVSREETLK
jgi:hypothetical protein